MFRWTVHLSGGTKDSSYAAVTVNHKVYCFGLHYDCNMDQIGVHIFNTASLRWMRLPPRRRPTGRGGRPPVLRYWQKGHTAVLIEDIAYIWGGYPYHNALQAFDVDTHRWFEPNVSGFSEPRFQHSACVLGKVMYIYGGYTHSTGRSNDICKLDTTSMVWSSINTRGTPPPVSNHETIMSTTFIGTKMFVFGGGPGALSGTIIRVFDTETNCWLSVPSAQLLPERLLYWGHLDFAYNRELYIFGGYDFNEFNDVWKFNVESFTWKKFALKGKGPYSLHKMCCCMVGDRIFLFDDEVYVLDLSPSLKTLCKLAVIQQGLEQSELPHDVRWELAAMTGKKESPQSKRTKQKTWTLDRGHWSKKG